MTNPASTLSTSTAPASTLPFITADEVYSRVSFADAVAAFHRDLRAGLDPANDHAKTIVDLAHGQVLMMPTESSELLGVKVVTVAPANPDKGLERIQGHYLLFDSATLTPVALMDGVALTTLRTPALSAAAADILAPAETPHLLVFGSGPQAWGHVEALRAVRTIERVTIVARNQERAQALADQVTASGIPARVGVAEDVADAQLIACATTAREPLFDGSLIQDNACVMAVGSHELDARELDSALIARSQVVIEEFGAAMREGGDVYIPLQEGVITEDHLIPVKDIVTGAVEVDHSRPRVFKSSGMPWEDLVVASVAYAAGK
ncbi:ornithine cyclodeaminase family protein [Homoserinimonas sp. OAct 916]|uniref:ornithine cyclodeaminase family protein n=1 Tax=Homoserinimonas sp. OAct 916 TaxID=2211450 RepID=UPI000DBE11FD|nr:ornithine cyclodeaminase family protein [Homoserinimonas sp. OAct 916]